MERLFEKPRKEKKEKMDDIRGLPQKQGIKGGLGQNIEELKALSHETRQTVLLLLSQLDTPTFKDLSEHVESSSSVLSYHLNVLRAANLIQKTYTEREEGTYTRYMITEKGKKYLDLLVLHDKEAWRLSFNVLEKSFLTLFSFLVSRRNLSVLCLFVFLFPPTLLQIVTFTLSVAVEAGILSVIGFLLRSKERKNE